MFKLQFWMAGAKAGRAQAIKLIQAVVLLLFASHRVLEVGPRYRFQNCAIGARATHRQQTSLLHALQLMFQNPNQLHSNHSAMGEFSQGHRCDLPSSPWGLLLGNIVAVSLRRETVAGTTVPKDLNLVNGSVLMSAFGNCQPLTVFRCRHPGWPPSNSCNSCYGDGAWLRDYLNQALSHCWSESHPHASVTLMDDSRIINVTRLDLNIDVAPRFWTYDVMPEPNKNGKVSII